MNYKLPHDKYWVNVFKMEMGKQDPLSHYEFVHLWILGSSHQGCEQNWRGRDMRREKLVDKTAI